MVVNAAAENALGTLGTVCWAGQIIPQIVKSHREKSTEGLSPWLMLIWSFSALPLGIYSIVQNINIPIIVQPQLFGSLAAISVAQCLYYGQKRSLRLCLLFFFVYVASFGGLEGGMVVVSQHAKDRGNDIPVRFFGILSPILIALGLVPQYIEIYKRKEVIGISLVFMFIDIMGGVFSTLSLAFKPKLDTIAMITYLAVIVLDAVVVIAAYILNPRAKRRRLREQEAITTATAHLGKLDTEARAPSIHDTKEMREVPMSSLATTIDPGAADVTMTAHSVNIIGHAPVDGVTTSSTLYDYPGS